MNVFPLLPGQEFVSTKSPTWNTTVKTAYSGRQLRSSRQSAPIWKFKVSYEFLRDRVTQNELKTLLAFFNSAQGQLNPWYYNDPTDNSATNSPVGVGDGATTSFQLSRVMAALSPTPFIEPIFAVQGIPEVMVNGAAVANYSVGPFGTIIFSQPPNTGDQITWTGLFYFLCHFTQDNLDTAQMVKDIWTNDGVEFESLLP